MPMRVVTGEGANLLARALSVTVTDESGLYPPANLWDNVPGRPFRFGTAGADRAVTADLAAFDGAMEDWAGSPAAPAGWTRVVSGTGDVVETTTAGEVRSGSAAKLNRGTGTAQLQRDFSARSGERWQFDGWARIAGAGSAKAYLQNRHTLMWLTPGGWQSAQAPFVTEAAATSYEQQLLAFQVESWEECLGADQVTLRVTLEDGGAGGAGDFAFWEDVAFYPGLDVAAIVGHNIEPHIAVQLRRSNDGFVANDTLAATLTKARPAFYGALQAAQYERYWRILNAGTNGAAIWKGELVLAQSLVMDTSSRWPLEDDLAFPQERAGGELASRSYLWTEDGLRTFRLTFRHRDLASIKKLRDEVVRRSRGGFYPLLVIARDTDPESCIFGRVPDRRRHRRLFDHCGEDELPIEELPLPTFVE